MGCTDPEQAVPFVHSRSPHRSQLRGEVERTAVAQRLSEVLARVAEESSAARVSAAIAAVGVRCQHDIDDANAQVVAQVR